MYTPSALFILKRREDYSENIPNFNDYTVVTGMYNSSKFVSDMLKRNGIKSKVEVVIDNNCIDRVVSRFRPTHVFIEGFWVVPEKFDVLKRLHPGVKWIIRCHSELPFLAQEGIAMKWVKGYLSRDVSISGNSKRINDELQLLASAMGYKSDNSFIPLLPNQYPNYFDYLVTERPITSPINVACFGAVRPLKNHLLQAVAAIKFAKDHKVKLNFHINSNRIESGGSNTLKNLRELFEGLPDQYNLVEHPWLPRPEFIQLLNQMTILLQVSFSETFNIVTADALSAGIPVVVSNEISWVNSPKANPTSVNDIVEKMEYIIHRSKKCVESDRRGLLDYLEMSKNYWLTYLHGKYMFDSPCGLKKLWDRFF